MFYKKKIIIYKMSECNSVEYSSIESAYLTYYKKTWDAILNRVKDYYENDKERLRKQSRDR